MSQSHDFDHSSPAPTPSKRLRLYDATAPDAPQEITLRALAEEYIRARIVALGRSNKTATGYRETVAWWEKLIDEQRVPRIRTSHTLAFGAALAEQRGRRDKRPGGMSADTRHRHLRQIKTLLRHAGKRGRRYRDDRAVYLRSQPAIDLPDRPEGGNKVPITFAEFEALLAAVDRAHLTAPENAGLDLRQWWRTILLTGYWTAFRREALFQMRFDWLMIETLGVDASTSRPIEQGTWRVPAGAWKGRTKAHEQPCHPSLLAAIQAFRTDRELVFPCASDPRWIDEQFNHIMDEAKVSRRVHWGLKFHGLRKLSATEIFRVDASAAQRQCGHADEKTTREYYVAEEAKSAGHRKAQSGMRAPKVSGPQRRLFE